MGAIKFIDDLSIKFQEDISLKFTEDPKLKFRDDPIKFKFQDDNQGSAFKAFDDVKLVGLDKAFSDQKMIRSSFRRRSPLFSRPLIIPWHGPRHLGPLLRAQTPIDAQTQQKLFESHLQQVKETRQQLQNQIKQLDEYEKKVSEEFRKLTDEQKKTSKK